MKRFLYTIAALAAISCSDGADETSVPVAPFTLSVDRQEIESDGVQTATFTIVDANGLVVTDNSSLMGKVHIKNETDGTRLARRTKTFRTIEDGEYTFSATCTGIACENKVTVRSKNRSNYEVYRKNVCVYRFTATWCQYCPAMTEGFEKVSDWTKGRHVEMAIHGADSKYQLAEGAVAAELLRRFYGSLAFPSCVYDLDLFSDEKAYTDIESLIFDRLAQNPATCGIKADCSYVGGTLAVNATIKTSTGGKYDIGYALLKDNCPGGEGAYEDVYHNVLLAVSENYQNMSDKAAQVEKNAEMQFTYSYQVTVPSDDNLAEYSVVVFALKENGSKVVIDNVVEMPLVGGSVDYVLN